MTTTMTVGRMDVDPGSNMCRVHPAEHPGSAYLHLQEPKLLLCVARDVDVPEGQIQLNAMHRASGFLALEDKVTVLGMTASQAAAMPQMESVAFSVRRIKKTASTEPQNVDVSVLSSLMSTFFSGHVFRVAQEVALVSKASGMTFTFRGAWKGVVAVGWGGGEGGQ